MLATWDSAVREWAWNYGYEVPDREWLLHDNDIWVKNPHYTGKAGRHPEDDIPDEDEDRSVDDRPSDEDWR